MVDYTMDSKAFFKALESDQLIGSRCKVCGAYTIPQRQVCPKCHSDQTELITYSGKGKLVAYTVISVPPVKMVKAGYDAKNPYCSGIVELEEGPRISAQILDVDVQAPETIKIGMPLTMTTITRTSDEGEETFLAFRPV